MLKRFEGLVIGGAIVAVSGSVAGTLWGGLGVPWAHAALAGMALALALIFVAARVSGPEAKPDPSAVGRADMLAQRLESVETGLRAVARRILDLEARVETMDKRAVDDTRNTVDAVASELSAVGAVVRDLAETVAHHDAELASWGKRPTRASADRAAMTATLGVMARDNSRMIGISLATDSMEMHLQGIVTLPQRRVRLYEALSTPRGEAASIEMSRETAVVAAGLGLSKPYDPWLLDNALKVARHLSMRERDVPLVVHLSLPALTDPAIYRMLSDVVQEQPALAGRLIIALSQEALHDLGPLEADGLEAMRTIGLRFLLDAVHDLRLDGRALFERGFRYVKTPASLLVGAAEGSIPTDIHAADLAGLLARNGVTLIADGVVSDTMLPDLAAFSVGLAQGELFGGPRPVRQEVLNPTPSSPLAEVMKAGTAGAAQPAAASARTDDAAAASPPSTARAAASQTAEAERRTSLRAFLRRSGA